jgi:hypothetical protein
VIGTQPIRELGEHLGRHPNDFAFLLIHYDGIQWVVEMVDVTLVATGTFGTEVGLLGGVTMTRPPENHKQNA